MKETPPPPLPKELEDLLRSVERPTPPPGFEQAVRDRVQTSLALGLEVGSSPPSTGEAVSAAHAASLVGKLGVPLSIATLAIGGAVGVGVGRALQPAPAVVERIVYVDRPAPAPPPEPQGVEAPAAAPAARAFVRPSKRDASLAEERSLLEVARAALSRRDHENCRRALRDHAARFADGRLAEEREALWIQLEVVTGELQSAKRRGEAFRAKYPGSLLLPAVNESLSAATP